MSEIYSCPNCGGTDFLDFACFNAVVSYEISHDENGFVFTNQGFEMEEDRPPEDLIVWR